MANTPRRTRKSPSTTTSKSSEKPTEKHLSDSKASEKESDGTSTQTEESSSSSSSDDENDALFDEADQKAADAAESDDEDQDEDESTEDDDDAPEAPEGEVVTFHVEDPAIGTYDFQGVVSGNTIVVTEDASREFRLPGSKKKGRVLAHYKGQMLPLASFERYIKTGK